MQHAAAQPHHQRLPLIALLVANAISQIGNVLTFLAIPWFVLVTTGSAAKTGLTAVASLISFVVAGVLGGALVDRLGYRRTSIIADLASAVPVALVPLLDQTIGLAFWQLLLLVFLGGILDVPGMTARRSMVPELAAQAGMPLERANGLFRLVDRFAGLVGPPLSGLLIGVIGASSVLWIDAATFLVSAGVVAALIPPVARAPQPGAPEGATSYLQEVTDGFRFLRADRPLLVFGIAFAVAGMLAEPVYGVILPVYAKEVYGSAVDLGIVFAGLAAGSLAGNLVYIAIGPRLPRRGTFILGLAVRALAFWVLLPMPPVIVVAGAIAIAALFVEPGNPLFDTIMQERVPAGMRGRVYGAFGALSVSLRPVGLLGYGLLLDQVGLRTTLFLFAGVNLLVPVCLLLLPVVQGLEQPRARPAGREP